MVRPDCSTLSQGRSCYTRLVQIRSVTSGQASSVCISLGHVRSCEARLHYGVMIDHVMSVCQVRSV